MPTQFSGRITLIVAIFLAAVLCIFPMPSSISKFRDPKLNFIQKTDLKPGIDMVGGLSLIYEIHPADPNNVQGLADRIIETLKDRIDPNGVANYVWRKQGNLRIEIQIPLAGNIQDVRNKQKAYSEAQQMLDLTNIPEAAVVAAVEHDPPKQRDEALAKFASDSQSRKLLFAELTQTFDQIQALKANKQNLSPLDLATQIEPLSTRYEALKARIEESNLSPVTLEQALDAKAKDQNAAHQVVLDYQKKFADFPARVEALNTFWSRWLDFQSVKTAVTDATDLKRKLQSSGVLEFHILADSLTVPDPQKIKAMDDRLKPDGRGPLPQPGDDLRWLAVDRPDEFDRPGYPKETHEWNGKHYMLVISSPDGCLDASSKEKWQLADAGTATDPNGQSVVTFKFNPVGARLFGNLTQNWYNQTTRRDSNTHARLGIVLDNKLYSAPNINSPILGGSGEISGGGATGFDSKELEYLVSVLRSGSLPAQLSSEPVSEEQVAPSLGTDNLIRGLVACAFGLAVVAVFLVSYYYIAGIVAFGAVMLNLVLILGSLAGFGATFTLPCIAGIVLTVGTAVDANVLIFERLREEQHRGLPLRLALRNSYDRAFSAIVDSNMTSAITSICLWFFGSEEIKGFGLTLLIGIFWSLFTALFVTKTVFGLLIEKFHVRNLSSLPLTFPKWDKLLHPDWDWMGKAWIFYTFSTVAIASGLVLFVLKVRDGKMMAIEFTSGTSVQFAVSKTKYPNGMPRAEVQTYIDAESEKEPAVLPYPSVVAVGTDHVHYEILTSNIDRDAVKNAVLKAMAGKLEIQLPSTFKDVNQNNAADAPDAVLPIKDAALQVDGFAPPAAAANVGGVAIALRDISPPLSPNEIRARMEAERLAGGALTGTIDYAVQAPGGPDDKTSFAVIVGWNPSVAYSADQASWSAQLAEPLWKLAVDAIDRPPSLEKEINFDAQVAGQMQRDAFLALFFSIIVIMAYIWWRFGNLKYGTATIIALIHDTVFTLAALGYAHYLSGTALGGILQLQPFRIDLTVVAGILTIMGYSMLDTIVVFDRIRENRGKFGHLDRGVINRAINETLSRTLLTAGTSIITVSFMYFIGGSGVHGFTFVLLIGILVGTYSSVAIAAPLLLLGKEKATAPTAHPAFGFQRSAVGQG